MVSPCAFFMIASGASECGSGIRRRIYLQRGVRKQRGEPHNEVWGVNLRGIFRFSGHVVKLAGGYERTWVPLRCSHHMAFTHPKSHTMVVPGYSLPESRSPERCDTSAHFLSVH